MTLTPAERVTGTEFAATLGRHGLDFFAGVPCSILEGLIHRLEAQPASYVAAVREDLAVGVAGGAWFGGRLPVVLMQNSGLGTSLNALTSFSLMYGLPSVLLVTWRGHDGRDAPEHLLSGRITLPLLDLLGIAHRTLGASSLEADVAWAAAEARARLAPVALVVPPGLIGTAADGLGAHAITLGAADPKAAVMHAASRAIAETAPLVPRISRRDAIAAAVKRLDDAPVVHANGYICRESFSVADRAQNFYMLGSMGLASAIGLGVALTRPRRRVVVFDGDGNLLMALGMLAMVAARAPANLVHCVFDNEVYGSTGNQRSPSRRVRLDRLAAAAGYASARAVTTEDEMEEAMQRALTTDGPHFVLAKVTTDEADVPRIPHSPAAIRDRFRAALAA